jgi:hypothetical protein
MKHRVRRKRVILDVKRDESAVARPPLRQDNVQSGGAMETEPESSQSPAAPSKRKGRWRTVSPQGHAKQSRR